MRQLFVVRLQFRSCLKFTLSQRSHIHVEFWGCTPGGARSVVNTHFNGNGTRDKTEATKKGATLCDNLYANVAARGLHCAMVNDFILHSKGREGARSQSVRIASGLGGRGGTSSWSSSFPFSFSLRELAWRDTARAWPRMRTSIWARSSARSLLVGGVKSPFY